MFDETSGYDGDAGLDMNGIGSIGFASGTGYATVTTNDPAPAGDLNIRSGPGTSYAAVGKAEKGGLVTVLDWGGSSGWAKISWPGGSRLPQATGFASTTYLREAAPPAVPPPVYVTPTAPAVVPSGPAPVPSSPSAPSAPVASGMSTAGKVGLGAAALGALYFGYKALT